MGSCYFPQSRVECHYSLSSQHTWASNDWIGLFKAGWRSVRDYHTFVWALAPAGYQEGTDVNCCVHFHVSYLPNPSSQQYQFVYVDGKGGMCSQSPLFTFAAPKPLEDLVTLEEGTQGEEGDMDMLLVVPRAELLQGRLQECLRERAELLHAREAADMARGRDRERHKVTREAWERGRQQLEDAAAVLREELRQARDKMEEMEREQEEVQASVESLAQEKSALLADKEASEQQIRQLEEDIKTLAQRTVERETEVERMKERAKKMAALRREEDDDRKAVQAKLEQTEAELRSLAAEFRGLRSALAQRDTQALQLRDAIATLTHKLHAAHRKEAESEASLSEAQAVRGRLGASERLAESLRRELSTAVAQRDHGQGELHQARLQAAQLTLQLADASLALREGRADWAQDRQSLQRAADRDRAGLDKLNGEMQQMEEKLQEERMEREKAEVELGREKDCNRVQLGETRRELQELKASLRVAQKEKEQMLIERQELMEYMSQLEQRMEVVADNKWSTAVYTPTSRPDSPLSDSEDENSEALQQSLSPSRALGHYSLCEKTPPSSLLPATSPSPSCPRELPRSGAAAAVVICQPAPLSSPRQAAPDTLTHSSESEEEFDPVQCGGHSSGEEMALLLPDHTDTVLSDLADVSLW